MNITLPGRKIAILPYFWYKIGSVLKNGVKDLARKQQVEVEILHKKTLNEARDARYLARNKIIHDFEKKMQELGAYDMDDDEYDLEEKKLQDEMKYALDTFDEETKRQGQILFDKDIKVKFVVGT